MDQLSDDFEDSEESSSMSVECPAQKIIKNDLDLIEARIGKASDRRRSSVPFPTGFGFFLADDTHIPPEVMEKGQECELGRLYDHIMCVEDRETKDRLLCFLDDYRAQRDTLQKIKNNRIDVLQDLLKWLMQDNTELQRCESTHLYPAMTAESKFRECYMDTFATYDKLCQLKKELTKPIGKEHGPGGSSEG